MEKIRIPVALQELSLCDDLDFIIEELCRYNEEFTRKDYTNLRIQILSYGYDHIEYVLYGDRLETDEEYNSRMKVAAIVKKHRAKKKLDKDERDLKEYKRLRKKFEGK